MADGLFYNDLRAPFMVSDLATVTLATTDKALYTPSSFPYLGPSYFAFAGKRVRIRLKGKITTVLTPGNGQFDIYWGNGTDANGTIIASSAALALTASQTNLSWYCDVTVRCVTPGSAGTLYAFGDWGGNVGVLASTLQPAMIPASAAAVSGSVDLTVANIISVQFKRSGSTAETMTVQDLEVVALN